MEEKVGDMNNYPLFTYSTDYLRYKKNEKKDVCLLKEHKE